MKFDRKDRVEIFENAISWIVVFAMFIYGGAKILQFDGASEIDKTVSEMTGMELMWAFYGYSKSYAIILGLFVNIVWDGFFKQLINYVFYLLLSVSTLGFQYLRNDIYVEIAKGFHESTSLFLANMFLALMLQQMGGHLK